LVSVREPLRARRVGFAVLRDLGVTLIAADSSSSFLDEVLSMMRGYWRGLSSLSLARARERERERRENYQVALTLGNHPTIDLMVISPNGTPFFVDVKGQYRNNWWPVKPKEEKRKDLFYVLAYVPDPKEGGNRFFILTQDEADTGAGQTTAAWRARKPAERADKVDPMPCVSPEYAQKHENCWKKLPA
jgi:hypothetical protein